MKLRLADYRRIALASAVILLAVLAFGLALLHGGYNVAATAQHTSPVYALLDYASKRSITLRARLVNVPPLPADVALGRGLEIYREHCVQCHGAPGVAPSPFALGLTPAAANLALKSRERSMAELYWTIRYGLKMTAMPAWEFRLADADLWAVTAFVAQVGTLSPDDYQRLAARTPREATPMLSAEPRPPRADVARGALALQQYACGTCHEIPGIVGADNPVGPSLAGFAARQYVAGTLPNTTANQVAWIRAPAAIKPGTAMPDLHVSERDAHDIAAFLDTLQ